MATLIRESAGGDLAVIQAACLLHHLGGPGEGGADADKGAEAAKRALVDEHLDEAFAEEVAACIVASPMSRRDKAISPEAKVVWDANQLDFLGMVGLARLFALAGQQGAPLFGAQSRASVGPGFFGDPPASVEAFFEHHLKGLPDLLHFGESRHMARRRIELSEAFFARANAERQMRR
jgi:uncharacterized protein